ncbi:MAG: glycosyltransferase, partial [Oscillospiraceae bacterium]
MGKTKTRLEKALTREACVKAHSAFLKDIFDSAMSQEWDTFVFYNKDGALDILKNILPLQKEFYPQKGESLGEKMYSAISQVLKKGYDACVLV